MLALKTGSDAALCPTQAGHQAMGVRSPVLPRGSQRRGRLSVEGAVRGPGVHRDRGTPELVIEGRIGDE